MASKNNFRTHELCIEEFSSNLFPKNQSTSYIQQFSIRCKLHINEDTADGTKTGIIRSSFILNACAQDSAEIYASIKGTVVGLFSVDAATPTHEFENMLRLNGMLTILPMMRSSIYSIGNLLTIRAPMIIPNLDVTQIEWDE